MPSGKKSKEATWKEDELLKSLKAVDTKSKSKSSERESSKHRERSRHRDTEEDKKDKGSSRSRSSRTEGKEENGESRRHRDSGKADKDSKGERTSQEKEDREKRKHKERSSRRDNDGSLERKSGRDRDKSKERSKDDRGRDDDKHRDREKRRERDRDKERRHKDGERDRDKERERDRDKEKSRDREREKGRSSESRKEREKERDSGHEKGIEAEGGRHRRREKDKDRRRDKLENDDNSIEGSARSDRSKEKEGRHDRKERERRRENKERRKEKDLEESSTDSREKEKGKSGDKSRRSRHKINEDYSHTEENNSQDLVDPDQQLGQEESKTNRRHRGRDSEALSQGLDEGEPGTSLVNAVGKDQGKEDNIPDDVDYGATNNYDDYNYDNEDFEDYDDDFEDDTNVKDEDSSSETEPTDARIDENTQPVITLTASEQLGMEQLKQAIYAENEIARSASRSPSRPSTMEGDRGTSEDTLSPSTTSLTPSPLKGRINFVAAKQKQISNTTAMKTKQRGKELLKLLELDAVSIHLFELLPTNEYELYMKNFGTADSCQVSVQASVETYDGEGQTDEIEMESKWCQHSNEVQASGAGEEVGKKFYQIDSSANSFAITTNTVRLNNFLAKSSQVAPNIMDGFSELKSTRTYSVCLSLLEEEAAAEKKKSTNFQEINTSFSSSYIEFGTNHTLIQGREIKCVSPPSSDIDLALTAYGPSHFTKENADLAAKGLLCIWKSNEPDGPQRLLISESIPLCCCFSPSKASFAFAGMDDGSVVIWDLSESPGFHMKRNIRNKTQTLFSSTFTTASVLAEDNHKGPVVALTVLSQQQESHHSNTDAGASTLKDGVGLSFQIATLDEHGLINIWIIVEVERPDVGGSEVDLGLSPGGKVKLLKTGSIALDSRVRKSGEPGIDIFRATCFQVRPSDPNHFYIGSDKGHVVHKARFGERASPRAYKSSIESSHAVLTLDISPWNIGYFLVGYDNGCLRLYRFQNELPLCEWLTVSNGAPYTSVQWSRCRPSVFFTLDANNTLCGWDLMTRSDFPIWQETLGQGNKKLTYFTLLGGSPLTTEGENHQTAEMVLFYESGFIELHKLSSSLSTSNPDELERFLALMEET